MGNAVTTKNMGKREERLFNQKGREVLVVCPFFIEMEKAISACLKLNKIFSDYKITLMGDRKNFLPGGFKCFAQIEGIEKIALSESVIGPWFYYIPQVRRRKFDLAIILSAPFPGSFRHKVNLILAALFMGTRKIMLCEIAEQVPVEEDETEIHEPASLSRAGLVVKTVIQPKDILWNMVFFLPAVLLLIFLAVFFKILVCLRVKFNRLRWRAAGK